ncbi:hypothetical protein Tco_0344696 [Tanacetum coccineum]
MAKGEIYNLIMEQYLALTRGNQAPGMVKPEIGGNVNFEIKSQFMRELRDDTFSRNKNDDAREHVERVLDIVSLFHIPEVSHDVVMLRVFPITLTGAAKSQEDDIHPLRFYSGDMNHLIVDCPKPPRNKDQNAFVGGSWSDSEEEDNEKTNKETSEDLNEIDIETLTLEQYLALNCNNSQVGVKRPKIEKNIIFEIKSQLLRELRENTFSVGKTKNAMEHDNKVFPNYENPRDNPPSPNKSPSRNWNPVEKFQDSDDNLENVNEFVEKGLAEVIFGKPFKEEIGLEEDISKGIIRFKIGDDKTIFNMPRAEKRLKIVCRISKVEKEKQSRPKERRVHWCKAILQDKENRSEYWPSCDPNQDVCYGGDSPINKVCKMTSERILKDHWRDKFREEENDLEDNLKDPEECGEDKAKAIKAAIHDKLNDDWFNNTSEDEDDLEGILDYLEPRSYD